MVLSLVVLLVVGRPLGETETSSLPPELSVGDNDDNADDDDGLFVYNEVGISLGLPDIADTSSSSSPPLSFGLKEDDDGGSLSLLSLLGEKVVGLPEGNDLS